MIVRSGLPLTLTDSQKKNITVFDIIFFFNNEFCYSNNGYRLPSRSNNFSDSCVVHGYIDKSILCLNNFDVYKLNEKILKILSENVKFITVFNVIFF